MRRVERVLWMAGIVLLTVWGALRAQGSWSARRDVARFDAALGAPAASADWAAAPDVDTSQWSASRRRHYEESLARDPGPALAVLSIASVGLEVPVLEGTCKLTLERGSGHIEGTPAPGREGNVGIAGHRDGFFRALKGVRLGDVVELRTPAETVRYVVEDLRIVAPDDVSVLAPTAAPTLTLVTCYPFYFVGPAPQRYIVRAVRP
jgi:sortase A